MIIFAERSHLLLLLLRKSARGELGSCVLDVSAASAQVGPPASLGHCVVAERGPEPPRAPRRKLYGRIAIPSMSSAATTQRHSLRKLRSSNCREWSPVRNALHKKLQGHDAGPAPHDHALVDALAGPCFRVTQAHGSFLTAVVEDDVVPAQLEKLRCSENQAEGNNAHGSDTSKTCLDERASEACQHVCRKGERTSRQFVSFSNRQK